MRDRDSLILESLYKNILLNDNRNELSFFDNRVLDDTAHAIKDDFNMNHKNDDIEIHLKDEIIKKKGSQIDFNDSYKMAYEMFSKDEFIKVSEPWQILSKTLYETYRYYAKNKYWSVIWDAKNKRQRIGKEEYDELKNPVELIRTHRINYAITYLHQIESIDLTNIYDPEEWDDSEYIAENNNDDLNVLTIMNNILYPVKGMEKLHDMYEKLFKKMIVEENPKKPSYPKVKLFNTDAESKITANTLINYLGKEEFLVHKQFLNILAHMIVYQFKDDPNLEGDYSKLLYLGAFVF